MILDALGLAQGQEVQAKICVIGAGAAGIVLALSLAERGHDVLLVESGLDKHDSAHQALYAGEVADEQLHSPPDRYRERRLGGSTTIWGGRCVPFDRQDFVVRAAVRGSGWPISYEEVARYYPAATRWCDAGVGGYEAASALAPGQGPLFGRPVGMGLETEGLERFSLPTNFWRRYRHRLAACPSLRVLPGLSCVGLELDEGEARVQRVQLASLQGLRVSVVAERVVLAVGGLETPRLLLNMRRRNGVAIGNGSDALGRYYMCHYAGSVGHLKVLGDPRHLRHGYELSPDGIYCRRRLTLDAPTQGHLRSVNAVMRLHFPAVADPSHGSSILSGIYLLRGLLSHEYSRRLASTDEGVRWRQLRHLGNVLRYPFDAMRFGAHWFYHRRLVARKFPSVILPNRANAFSLEVNAEQSPLADSRVTLTEERDALGLQRLRVDWRYSADDIAGVARTLRRTAQALQAAGVATFSFDEDRLVHDLTCYGAYGGHHIGTARMGHSPRDSVVNADARLHDLENLYLAGSAVFPTSSQANPTLTLVALALRLADHLAEARA